MRAGRAPYGSSRAWVVWAVRAHLLGPVRLVHAGLPPVGDADALVLAQIPRTDLLGNVHGGTIPVHRRFLVPAVRSCPSVAPHLAGAFGHAHRPRGLREVHARLEMLDVPASPRRAHLATRRVLHALEHPPVHLALPSVSQALRRSLEPALRHFFWGERPVAASVRWESDASSLRMMRRFIPLADG